MSIYLSASSIKDFIACPRKVMYRVKKTVEPISSTEMGMGTVVHKALELGWRTRDVAYAIMKDEAKKAGMKKADTYTMEFCLDMFFLNFRDLVREDDLIEWNFKLPLYDDVFIVGKVDRISNGNVFDWKTGQTATNLSYDIQCIIYDWAYQKQFNKSASSICIGALKKGELIPYHKNSLYVDEVFNNIIPRMIRTIKNEWWEERLGLFNHSCFRCPYRIGCLEKKENELDSPEFME
jgi:CRISPR/Cas system-associated exonuclease Cas4 (RecB family)